MTRLAIMLLGMGVLFFFKKKKKKPEASSVAVVQPLPISPIALSKSDSLVNPFTDDITWTAKQDQVVEAPAGSASYPPWVEDVVLRMFAKDHILKEGEVQPPQAAALVVAIAAQNSVPAAWVAALWAATSPDAPLAAREAKVAEVASHIRQAMMDVGQINATDVETQTQYVGEVLKRAVQLAGL